MKKKRTKQKKRSLERNLTDKIPRQRPRVPFSPLANVLCSISRLHPDKASLNSSVTRPTTGLSNQICQTIALTATFANLETNKTRRAMRCGEEGEVTRKIDVT